MANAEHLIFSASFSFFFRETVAGALQSIQRLYVFPLQGLSKLPLLGSYHLSTSTNIFTFLLLPQACFSDSSLLRECSIMSMHLISLDSHRFREPISSRLYLRLSGIISRPSIILDSRETRTAHSFSYLSTLVRLAERLCLELCDV